MAFKGSVAQTKAGIGERAVTDVIVSKEVS